MLPDLALLLVVVQYVLDVVLGEVLLGWGWGWSWGSGLLGDRLDDQRRQGVHRLLLFLVGV
eukprot:COSAG01_NODE_52170_length_348_cov_1.578313_2_plen_60_part_01